MKHIYLINPAAGRRDCGEQLREEIRVAYADADDIEVEVYSTTGVGDATRYVRNYCRKNPQEPVCFFACGGDGTFSEVASGAAGFAHAAVGLVPVGTGNDFTRAFIGSEHFLDMADQRAGEVIDLDLIRCNGNYGVNLFNTGFDCEVVVKTGEIKRNPMIPRGMAYGMGVAIELIRKPGVTVELSIDGGESVTKELLLCAVGNGACYGGGFTPLPYASMTDGLLDLCMVRNVSRAKFVRLVGSYKNGTHVTAKNASLLEYVRCKKVHMKFAEPQNVCMDGEVRCMKECEIEIVPGALHLVLPRGSALLTRPAYSEAWCGVDPVTEKETVEV